MHINRYMGILRAGVGVLAFNMAMVGAACATVIFSQPSEPVITGHTYVGGTHGGLPIGSFDLVTLQKNPDTKNGELVPANWDVGAKTGFTPTAPLTTQLGFKNAVDSTAAQMQGTTVGAYINSKDLKGYPANSKMMISPQEIFKKPNVGFPTPTSTITAGLDLQIPTASGSDTYVVADMLFLGPDGLRFSFGVKLFYYGHDKQVLGANHDPIDHSYQVNNPLTAGPTFVTRAPGSAAGTGTPWTGWRHFEWSFDQKQFVAALKYLAQHYPSEVKSTDPAKYVLSEVHLNAEFHFNPGAAELGWSMKDFTVTGTGGADAAVASGSVTNVVVANAGNAAPVVAAPARGTIVRASAGVSAGSAGVSARTAGAATGAAASPVSAGAATAAVELQPTLRTLPLRSPSFGVEVQGNRLVSAVDGRPVELIGATIRGLETGTSDRWASFAGAGAAFWSKVRNWGGSGLNTVRLPLNEASWLDYTCYDSGTGAAGSIYRKAGSGYTPDPAKAYQAAVQKSVADATAAGLYVILDLQWAAPDNAAGQPLCPVGQPSYADRDHSLTFWRQVADAFRGNPGVLFELFDAPFGSDVYANWVGPSGAGPDAVTLRGGGAFTPYLERSDGVVRAQSMTWQVAGMQDMVDVIRGEGASNVILSAPIGWAGEIETWLAAKPHDPIGQLAASWHVDAYNKGQQPPLAVLSAGYPIVITETQGLDAIGGYRWAASEGIGYTWPGWSENNGLMEQLSAVPWQNSTAP